MNFMRLLERPELFILRSRGANMDTFFELNQPWFHDMNFRTVLDIGANAGQFALSINAAIPDAHIYSFEPLSDCFEKLKNKHRYIDKFTPINIGVGNQSGSLAFERSSLDLSSSFLKMSDIHKKAFPISKESVVVDVKIEKLDTLVKTIDITEPLFIKIDVQGYEDKVLLGGEKTIKQAKLILIETSFVSLYLGQALFKDTYQILKGFGFSYIGSLDKIRHPKTGQILQEDSLFLRND